MIQPYPASGTLRDAQWIKHVPSKYSPSQVTQYLSVIGHESRMTAEAISSSKFPIKLQSLERIMRLHLLTFPFENTPMHYTANHSMDVSPEGVFHRLVNERKGSYCFGQNGLLLEMLRGLGFRAYAVSARVYEGIPPSYTPPSHLVLLVQPSANDNLTYVVDVGYGTAGIIRPLLLSADPDNLIEGISETERHRLTRTPREDSSLSSVQDLTTTTCDQWNLEMWHKKPDPSEETWRLLYSFVEAEFWLMDIFASSFEVYSRKTSIFWHNVLCIKMFTVDEGNSHLERSKRAAYWMAIVGNEVRRYIGPKAEVVSTMVTELDRIKALRDFFGVNLKDEDAIHIVGRKPAFPTP